MCSCCSLLICRIKWEKSKNRNQLCTSVESRKLSRKGQSIGKDIKNEQRYGRKYHSWRLQFQRWLVGKQSYRRLHWSMEERKEAFQQMGHIKIERNWLHDAFKQQISSLETRPCYIQILSEETGRKWSRITRNNWRFHS